MKVFCGHHHNEDYIRNISEAVDDAAVSDHLCLHVILSLPAGLMTEALQKPLSSKVVYCIGSMQS